MEPMKPMRPMEPMKPMTWAEPWWPGELGEPSSSGAQRGMRYAFFPEAHRLLVEEDGRRTTYDTGEHRISGVSQQHGGSRSVAFASEQGPVRVEDLAKVG